MSAKTNKSKRTWREPQENPVDPPPGGYENYMSFQKIINSNNGQIDEEKLEEHIEFMMTDPRWTWEEIPVDFSLLKPSDRIRYITRTPKGEILFRTGGWVTYINEDYAYLAYMAHTKTSWTLQAEDCQRLFVIKSRIKKEIHALKFKKPGRETKYSSYLVDEKGITQRVGSFKDDWTRKRFESSTKFIKASEGEHWIFKE